MYSPLKNTGVSEMKIPFAESQVMHALWRRAPLSRDEIIAEVGPANGWAPGTVKTLITRLLRKKAIKAGKEEAGYVYRPVIARADYVHAESKSLLNNLFDGRISPMVAHFSEHEALSAEDLAELKALIARIETNG